MKREFEGKNTRESEERRIRIETRLNERIGIEEEIIKNDDRRRERGRIESDKRGIIMNGERGRMRGRARITDGIDKEVNIERRGREKVRIDRREGKTRIRDEEDRMREREERREEREFRRERRNEKESLRGRRERERRRRRKQRNERREMRRSERRENGMRRIIESFRSTRKHI